MFETASGVLLRKVPEALAAGVSTGEYQVYGSVIRSLTSGRIIGHLQETNALTRIVGNALAIPLQPANIAIDIVGHTASFVQNEQIKTAISTLGKLQIGSVALGAASVGISIAGFAMLSRQLDKLSEKLGGVMEGIQRLERSMDVLREDRIRADFTDLRTIAERYEDGWLLSDPVTQWTAVESEAHKIANHFRDRMEGLLSGPATPLPEFEPFLEAWRLASDLRVSARLASNESVAAQSAALESRRFLDKIEDELALGSIALKDAGATLAGSDDWGSRLDQAIAEHQGFFDRLSARSIAAGTRVLTLAELETQGIAGRDWLSAARACDTEPLLYLEARAA